MHNILPKILTHQGNCLAFLTLEQLIQRQDAGTNFTLWPLKPIPDILLICRLGQCNKARWAFENEWNPKTAYFLKYLIRKLPSSQRELLKDKQVQILPWTSSSPAAKLQNSPVQQIPTVMLLNDFQEKTGSSSGRRGQQHSMRHRICVK